MEPGRSHDQGSCSIFSKLPPSQWADHLVSVSIVDSDLGVLARQIEVLKLKVREEIFMLSSRDSDTMKKNIHLIHLLESLALSYHFEYEIEETLKHAFENIEDLVSNENDLYTISIMFRVFRTYGHNMSSDVFKKFKGNDGKFKEHLIEDVMGMLSLYEAVHLGTTTDHILDEALSFTINHLEPLATSRTEIPPQISRLIQKALHIPQHQNSQLLVAKEFILFYEQEEDRNDTLLKLAKINFKFLQLHYIQELKTVVLWWRELDHSLNFPHNFRERTFETWFSGFVMYFAPNFSLGRILTAKLFIMMTFLDDACDTHGSVLEVESLVDCLERWDPDYMENLQGYMKTVFKFVMYFFNEYEDILRSQERIFVLEKMIEEFMIFARANLTFLKSARGGHALSFNEYVEFGGVEIGNYLTIACCIMGLEETGGKEAFEWLKSRPKFVMSLGAKMRLLDDITDLELICVESFGTQAGGYEQRVHCKCTQLLPKEHGVTKEEANREVYKMIGDINKIINEECLNTTTIPHRIVMQASNFGRSLEVLYTGDDVFNHREGKLKEYMSILLSDP